MLTARQFIAAFHQQIITHDELHEALCSLVIRDLLIDGDLAVTDPTVARLRRETTVELSSQPAQQPSLPQPRGG